MAESGQAGGGSGVPRWVLVAAGVILSLVLGAVAGAVVLVLSDESPEPRVVTVQRAAPEPEPLPEPLPPPPPPRVRVPAVVGEGVSTARRELRSRGFRVRIRREYGDASAGIVIDQAPAPGRRVREGARVRLTVSRGPEPLSTASTLSTSGLGSVAIGDTLEEAEAAAGSSFERLEVNPGCEHAEPLEGPTGVDFMLVDGIVRRIGVTNRDIETVSGLHVGSTEGEVRATLGGNLYESANDSSGLPRLVFEPDDPQDPYRMVFEMDGGIVQAIGVGEEAFALLPEGCA